MTSAKPKPKEICRNFAKCDCKYGDRCFNIHEQTSAPAYIMMRTQTPGSMVHSSIMYHVTVMVIHGVFTTSSSSPLQDDIASPDDIADPVPSYSLTASSVVPASPVASQCSMTPPTMSASSAFSSDASTSSSSTRAHYDFRHDTSRAPMPAHEVQYNLLNLTPPPRPIPVVSTEVDSDLSDEEYNVDSDNNTIIMVLVENQLVVQSDHTTLTQHMIDYFRVAVDCFHVDGIYGTYQEHNLALYKVFTNFTDAPGHYRTHLALFGWSPSYPLVNYGVNPVLRKGSPALLELITSLGSVFLRADRTAASTDMPLSETSYMIFSPLGSVYHAQQAPGSYVSMTSSLN